MRKQGCWLCGSAGVRWALLGAVFLCGACRQLNPAFVLEETGGAQTSTLRLSSTQAVPTQGVSGETTQDDGQSPKTSGVGGETTSDPGQSLGSTAQDQTSSEATSSESADSASTGTFQDTSSPEPPPAVCGGSETLCYAMHRDAPAQSYPAHEGKGPPLELVAGEGSLTPKAPGGEGIFANYIRVDGGGRLRINEAVKTGFNSRFGFDVTMRDVGCMSHEECYFARAGELVLQYNSATRRILCLSFDQVGENGRASTSVEPSKALNAACFALGNKIYLFVDGLVTVGERVSAPDPQATVRFSVGAPFPTTNNPGIFVGDIGRFRYWEDPSAMQRAVEAGK